MLLVVLGWNCFVALGLAQVMTPPPPLQISCSDPLARVYTRRDKDNRITCLWKAEIELIYSPSSAVHESDKPPRCAWHKNGAKLLDTSLWSGTVKISGLVGDSVDAQCVTSTCVLPNCVYQKTTIVMDRQDAKLFFTPPSPVQQYEIVQFGWCAKMKSTAWRYRFSSWQTEAGTVVPSNYHTEFKDTAYPADIRNYCSIYYYYNVQVIYNKPGRYMASLTVQNGPMPELSVSLEVEQTLLHVLSATSNRLLRTTDLKLSWIFVQLSSKVSAFQLTDLNKVGAWDVVFNKYTIKTDICSPPLNTAGYGFARIQFLTNASKIQPLGGEIDYTNGIVRMITAKSLGSVILNPIDGKSNTYYFSQLSGLYYFSSDGKVDTGRSVHFIFCKQESLTFLFQFKFVETQRFSLTAHVYLNTKSALYKSLEDMGVEVYLFNSGSSLVNTFIYIVWFIPLQHPVLQCKWSFILELYGSGKKNLFKNTTYTYKDSVSNAATFIPNTRLPFNYRLYAGFLAKVSFTRSGLKPVVLKTNVGTYASKILESTIYCYKVFCEIIAFRIKKPKYPSAILTTKGMHLSIFVNVQINCSASQGANIMWRIYRVSSASDIPAWDNYLTFPQVSPINQNSIEIPKLTLNYGFYIVNVSIDIAIDDDEDPSRSNVDSVVVEVRESDLIAVISGGSFRTVGFSEKWSLDGRFSYDPDSPDPSKELSFVWYCSKIASDYGRMILSAKANCHPDQTSLFWVNPNTVTQSVEPETLQGNRYYYFRLVASKENKTGYVDQTVFIASGSPPGVSVTCIENCLMILVPTERFSLSGKCTDCSKTSRPQYEWSLFQSSKEVYLDWTSQTTTGRSIAYISFIALTFKDLADMWYALQLQLTTWTGAISLYKYRFYVNSPPKAGDCYIKPSIGITLQTKFIVSCNGFYDQNLPLRYTFLVALDKLSHISSLQENLLGAIIYDGYDPTTPPLLLSTGVSVKSYVLKVYIQVYDSLSSYTQISRSVTVKSLYEGQSQEACLKELISQSHSPLMYFFLEIGDFINFGHSTYMIASVLNSFMSNRFLYGLKNERSELRERLLNMLSSVMITNIMAVNQIIVSISELTQDTKEVNAKSQQLAVAKLKEVGDALNIYRKEKIGSVECEILSSGILTSLSNIMNASLIDINRFTSEIPFNTVEVLKNSLSIMETVTDIISYGKVPGEADTIMVTNNFRISLKKEEKWDLEDSYRKAKDCLTCFYPTFEDDGSVLPVDSIVTAAFYEFKENPLPWLKNGKYIDTVITGFYIVATNDKGGLINLNTRSLDIIMERKNIIPIFDISVSPDVGKITSGIFCFEVNLEQKAEWFVQFFFSKKIIFNISLHIGDNISDSPVSFFQIPKIEKIRMKSREVPDLKNWNSKIIHIPMESIPKTTPVQNLTMELTTNYLIWKKIKLLRASIFNIACLDFEVEGNNWNEANCKVGPLSNNKAVHCTCDDLPKAQRRSVPFLKKRHTFLAARVLVMPNPIDLTKTTFRALRSNLVTLLTVIVVFIIYFALSIWARTKDKSDLTSKHTVIILPDNDPYETEGFLVTLYTGSRFGSGTTADVYLKIMGKTSDSQVHHLKCPGHQVFIRGGLDTFLVTARTTLGDISNIRIWHNNAGDSPGWFLSRVKVENMRTKQVWYFVCQNWFDIGKNDGLIHREFVPLKTHTPLDKLHYFYIQLSFKFCEDHLWFSIFLTALPGAFNRFRRLSCCLVILMSTLLVNIIFFNAAKNEDDEPKIHFLRSVMVGVESSLIAVPIQYLVLILLRLTEDKPSSQIHPFSESKLQDDTFYRSLNAKANNLEERLETFYQKQDNKDTAMEINSVNSGLHPLSLASFPTKQHISRQLHCDNFHRQLNNCVISETAANKIDTFSETAVEMQRQNFKRIGIGKKSQVIYIKRIQQMSSFVPPWWCIYVAWSFVFITSSISAVLIIMYGLTYGYELSFTWLLASALSFFQSVFVIEIVKIVFLIAFTSYFPKFYQDISWASSCFPEISLYEVPSNTDEARELHYKLVALRNTKQYKPPHDDEITILRKIATIKRKSYIFFRSLVSHIIFLTLLLHFVYSKDTSVFHYNQEIRKRFSYNLHRVHRVDQIYNWTSEVFLPLIHDHKQPGFIVESRSKIVGLPRMRQVKATYCNHTGSSLYVLLSDVLSCVKKYGIGEDFESSTVNKEFNPSEYTGYTYERSIPHWNYTLVGGKFGSGGYTAYFFPAKDLAHSLNRIQQLQNTNWLCEGMWAVVIELSAFNPDAHLFCSISIIFEAFDFGRLNPELSVHSFTMYTFQNLDSTNTFIILAFIAFLVIYTVSEIHAIVKLKKNYINVTNVINLFLKCLLFLSVVFYLTKLILAPFLLHLYSLYPNQFIPFYIVSYVDMMFKDTLGFLAHFTLLKSLRYTKYIYHVRLAEKALMTALSGICSMSLVVFICFIAFASFGYLVFGQAEWNYHTFLYATRTVFSYCISCFSKSSSDNNSFLCVLYLFLFLFVMSCVIINLFQVVILSTYGGMKHPVFEEASDEAEMIDFLVYKIRLAWVHLLGKHPEKCKRETTSSALYGKPQHKMENTVGLKRRKVSGKKTSILFI